MLRPSMNCRKLLSIFMCHALLFTLLCSFGAARASDQIDCPAELVSSVIATSHAPVNKVLFSTCKADPNESSRLYAVLAYKPRGYKIDDAFSYLVAVYDQSKGRTSSYHLSQMYAYTQDQVENARVEIDTARYNLRDGVTAFGVRIDTSYFHRCAESGALKALSLYAEIGKKLNRVFGPLETEYFNIVKGPVCGNESEETITHEWKLFLSLGSNRTNQFRDLHLSFKASGGATNLKCTTKYNRTLYEGLCRPKW